MRFRKLRIAWSVAWGVAAVLLLALWVRSYGKVEVLVHTNSAKWFTGVRSDEGEFIIYHGNLRPSRKTPGWTYSRFDDSIHQYRGVVWPSTYGMDGGGVLPYWFLVSLSAMFAVGPWIRQLRTQFSLRTLLIATTLIAMALGLIAWAIKT